jgi:hypothetical protein
MARYDFLNEISETPIFKYYEKHGENRAAAAALSKLRMEYGLASKMAKASIKVGAHIKGNKAMMAAGGHIRGGKKTIKKLLQWQKDNNFRVCDLERTDEWRLNQSIALKEYYKENPISNELRIQIGNKIKENNSKLTKKERSEKFSNDSATRKALRTHTDILNMIPTDTFNTQDARKACEKYGLGNWKGFLKNTNLIKQIHKGTNNYNPSIYQKI